MHKASRKRAYSEHSSSTQQAQRKRSVEVSPHAPASANASGFADFGRVTLAWQAMTSSVLSKVTEMERLMTEDHERIINESGSLEELQTQLLHIDRKLTSSIKGDTVRAASSRGLLAAEQSSDAHDPKLRASIEAMEAQLSALSGRMDHVLSKLEQPQVGSARLIQAAADALNNRLSSSQPGAVGGSRPLQRASSTASVRTEPPGESRSSAEC